MILGPHSHIFGPEPFDVIRIFVHTIRIFVHTIRIFVHTIRIQADGGGGEQLERSHVDVRLLTGQIERVVR